MVRPHFRLQGQDQIDSTNRGLWALVTQGAPAGTALIATTQSAGRGQWGRAWQSSPGGLYLSLHLKPEVPVQKSPYLTLASAWGIATSLRNLTVPVQVKWPNDLVARGQKLGGLLTETRLEEDIVSDVVIGVGLNGFNPVPSNGISIQQIFQPDLPPSPLNTVEGLAAVVLYGLIQGYLYWQNYGDQALLNAYHTYMANLGQMITVNDHQVQIMGVAASGNLQVQAPPDCSQPVNRLEIEPGKVTLGYNA
jgi:BirA family biotin operon repressor/biotin-[acetyl-CoA-carboxylase] ligase